MQREDWLLLFLATPARSGATPRSLEPLRIMKGLFLISQRGGGELDDLYQFKPYDYGPFTSDIYADLQVLGLRGLVTQEAVAGRSWRTYRPTTDGVERAGQLASEIGPADAATIDNAYAFVTTRGFLQLLRDIYAEYPAYAVNTVVQDAAPKQ
jgi:hypothetical protein